MTHVVIVGCAFSNLEKSLFPASPVRSLGAARRWPGPRLVRPEVGRRSPSSPVVSTCSVRVAPVRCDGRHGKVVSAEHPKDGSIAGVARSQSGPWKSCAKVALALQPFDNAHATVLLEGDLLEWFLLLINEIHMIK